MKNLVKEQDETQDFSLRWNKNPDSHKLLDILVSILSDEYIQKAKEHPEIFSK